jgi:Na+/melibiose symporter-like transporter
MYAAALPLGISLYYLFVPPAGLSESGLFAWLTLFAIAMRSSMTLFLVPYSALFAEFSDDYTERSQIVTFRYLFGFAGSFGFTFLIWTYVFPSTDAYTPGHLNPDAYPLLAAILAASAVLPLLLSTALTHREIPYLLQPQHKTEPVSVRRVINEVSLAFKNRSFLILLTFTVILAGVTGAIGALEIYLHTYFWELLPEDLRWFSFAVVGAFIAFGLVNSLQQRFDKKTLLLVGLLPLFFNRVVLVSLRFMGVLPENGELSLLLILIADGIIQAGALSVVAIVGTSMFADTMDKQELDTGLRQEGVFSSAMSFTSKATSGLGLLLGGLILEYVLFFPEGMSPENASPDLIFNLGLIAGIALPLTTAFPLYLVTRYDLTREKFELIQTELHTRREKANGQS